MARHKDGRWMFRRASVFGRADLKSPEWLRLAQLLYLTQILHRNWCCQWPDHVSRYVGSYVTSISKTRYIASSTVLK